ncbi:MAG: S1 RNA-binding domain-containing protein [Candidatus Latescibacteria bacterium]|nr:S1 RNA-binding domain-containing protein [Candidatus Latescibacterota bacterium]
MNNDHIAAIAAELSLKTAQIEQTAALIDDGATVPFIARYRKEITGSLDEVAVTAIRDRLEQLAELDKRRRAIVKSLADHGHLNDALQVQVDSAQSLTELEDIYLPYRPKRRTRATMAKEKGLEPLADALWAQTGTDPEKAAQAYIDAEKEVANAEDALAGARDIIAERINEDQAVRQSLRAYFVEHATIRSKVITGQEETGAKFRDYFDWQEPLDKAPSHRILAMRRGEKEGMLLLRVEPPEESALDLIGAQVVTGTGKDAEQVRQATEDGYRRLLAPSLETEMRLAAKVDADQEAIRVFSENVRQLLLAAPLGPKQVMGIDPGFRTGCKVVCLDAQGKLLHTDTVYPGQGQGKTREAGTRLGQLLEQYQIEAVAIGNGTGGREVETFLRSLDQAKNIQIVMVNESGASVYSASETARDEFPDHDLTVRGAVSIGRRLMDPLAELVKIDPKSIGVGQYQHDVDQMALKEKLDDVVMSCVNGVGVEVNTASKQLLTYVSGLGPQLAQNIIDYRNQNGPFAARRQLKDVPRMGPKAFEQSAGFLRIRDAANPLDASAVHPERYTLVDKMAQAVAASVKALMRDSSQLADLNLQSFADDEVGLPTLTDIVEELKRPGRDPRQQFESFSFADEINSIDDLQPGMKLPGIVTNVTNFGAFVDIGAHQDGLVHISQLADKYVKDPNDIIKVQQRVRVTVLEVDLERKRIALSMKAAPGEAAQKEQRISQPPPKQAGGQSQQHPQRRLKGKDRPTNRTKRGGQTDRPQRQPEADSALTDALRRAGLR